MTVELENGQLYPMLFEPNMHETVWGGGKLTDWKGIGHRDNIGESWEVSAVESSPSVIANGMWAGCSLPYVVAQMPSLMLGCQVAGKYNGKMPLLVKFIDAHSDLSIQVHPGDEMALREHGKFGKSEMWYVLDAEPGAAIYSGFKQTITPHEYSLMVENGTIMQTLARHEVHRGDVFYIPSGRVHAICSGVLLAEVQQSSDVTYRIYDYGRMGLDGKPRQLHTELAAQALDFQVEQEYRTDYSTQMGRASRVLESPYFSVRVTEFKKSFHRNLLKYDSFIICMCLSGDCRIKLRRTACEVLLREGCSCLIPAAVADYDIIPVAGSTRVLDAFIDNMDRTFMGRLVRVLHRNCRPSVK